MNSAAFSGEIKDKIDQKTPEEIKRFSEILEILKKLSNMVNRLVMGLVVAALIIGSSTLCTSEGTPKIFGISLGFFGYVAVAVFGIWILISSNKD